MSVEQYAVHTAPRGGKVDIAIDTIQSERNAAMAARYAYSRSKGADGLYQNESQVSGLLFKSDAPLPAGWSRNHELDGLIVAVPKAADRTKASREIVKAIREELRALPGLSGAHKFTNLIGGRMTMAANSHGRGFCLLSCWYERVDGKSFVFTPWFTKKRDEDSCFDDADEKGERQAFLPEGCERVGLSVYFAAKEAAVVAAKKEAA